MLPRFNGKAGKIIQRSAKIGREEIMFSYFLPNELPSMQELCSDISLMEKSNEANRAVGELQGLTKNIGNLDLFVEPYIRKEAVDSSEIEGTVVSLTDVFLSEAGSKKPSFVNPNIKEVINFVNAINYALSELKNGNKLSKKLLNNMHNVLLSGVRGQDHLVGGYRQQQNWVRSNSSRNILDAVYVPPSEEKVEELMNYLFSYMNENEGYMRLIKAGLLHYYFETIHPYEDGNGRVGRTLILLYLIQKGILEEPIIYLSPYFKKHKDTYYSLLMEVRETGNYSNWLHFYLDGIIEISVNLSKKVKRLIELYNDYKERLRKAGATPISLEILDKFFERPYSFISLIQEQLGKADYPKTKRGMNYLIECRIIKLYTKHKRNKIYVAPEVLKILEEDLI